MAVKIRLISKDVVLAKWCREIMRESGAGQWRLTAAGRRGSVGESGLWIWDYEPGLEFPAGEWPRAARHLFLVGRADLAAFRNTAASAHGGILLKPVTRLALRAFLVPAVPLRGGSERQPWDVTHANLKLQEYEQERTSLLTGAAGEMRVPLTAIAGYCGLLLSGSLGELRREQEEILRRMLRSSKRLTRVAAEISTLAYGRSVERRPRLQRGDLSECLDASLGEIAHLARERDIRISVDWNAGDRPVYFDRRQIEPVLTCLLENACAFSPGNGWVRIRSYPCRMAPARHAAASAAESSHEADALRIDVGVSGPPLPLARLERLFDQGSMCPDSAYPGPGRRLATCRTIMHRHQGRICAQNGGDGPVFSLYFPFHPLERVRLDRGQHAQ